MRIGISSVNVAFFAEGDAAAALGRGAEAAGIESLWTFEHIVVPAGNDSTYPYSPTGRMPGEGRAPITDPLGWLAFVAAVTDRIRLGTGTLILPEHNPVSLAKLTATIDRLSKGRLELGIGVGWLKEEFAALGVPWEGRGRRAEEYMEVMRRLWSDEETSFDGEHVHLDRAVCEPKPFRASGVPVVVGGHSDAAARRAGRFGDGFFPAASPERVGELIAVMRRAAEDAGRNPDEIEITSGGAPITDLDQVKRYEALGVSRLVVPVPTFDPRGLDEAFGRLHEDLISKVS